MDQAAHHCAETDVADEPSDDEEDDDDVEQVVHDDRVIDASAVQPSCQNILSQDIHEQLTWMTFDRGVRARSWGEISLWNIGPKALRSTSHAYDGYGQCTQPYVELAGNDGAFARELQALWVSLRREVPVRWKLRIRVCTALKFEALRVEH